MKQTLLLLTTALLASSAVAAECTTPGNGTTYTFEELSKIAESGVTKNGTTYTVSNDITVAAADSFKIDDGATVKLADAVVIRIEGGANLNAATATSITRNAETDNPKGFNLATEKVSQVTVKNLNFEYAALKFWLSDGSTAKVQDCTFKYANGKLSSSGAISLAETGSAYEITNCNFTQNEVPAIGGGANMYCGILVKDCYFEDNNTKNANRPQVNLTVGGDLEVVVKDNTFVGNKRTKVGAISVANMLGTQADNIVTIENNDVRYHRYGITTTGSLNAKILNNTIVENKYETNPMNGGSGISIYDASKTATVYVSGNHIEDNLWGITIIGGKDVNIGKVADPTAADYNPGGNVFKNNGNNGTIYDLYNNTQNTVYAQGNRWESVDEQTEEKIETVIYHKHDNADLGEVIFMPAAGASGVANVNASSSYFDSNNRRLVVSAADATVEVYDLYGKKVLESTGSNAVDLQALPNGVYLARVAAEGTSATTLKLLLK